MKLCPFNKLDDSQKLVVKENIARELYPQAKYFSQTILAQDKAISLKAIQLTKEQVMYYYLLKFKNKPNNKITQSIIQNELFEITRKF